MEVRNLPIPANQYPVPVTTRNTSFAEQQDQENSEQQTRPVNESQQASTEQNNTQQNIEANLQVLLQQQRTQQANSGIQDSQVRFSAQQAIETYQDIDSHEENQADTQVLSRVDELV